MLDLIEKDSFFKYEKINACPYKHYSNSIIWMVRVWRDDRPFDEETATLLRIIAPTAKEAASEAIEGLDAHIKAQKELARIRAELIKKSSSSSKSCEVGSEQNKAYTPVKKTKIISVKSIG